MRNNHNHSFEIGLHIFSNLALRSPSVFLTLLASYNYRYSAFLRNHLYGVILFGVLSMNLSSCMTVQGVDQSRHWVKPGATAEEIGLWNLSCARGAAEDAPPRYSPGDDFFYASQVNQVSYQLCMKESGHRLIHKLLMGSNPLFQSDTEQKPANVSNTTAQPEVQTENFIEISKHHTNATIHSTFPPGSMRSQFLYIAEDLHLEKPLPNKTIVGLINVMHISAQAQFIKDRDATLRALNESHSARLGRKFVDLEEQEANMKTLGQESPQYLRHWQNFDRGLQEYLELKRFLVLTEREEREKFDQEFRHRIVDVTKQLARKNGIDLVVKTDSDKLPIKNLAAVIGMSDLNQPPQDMTSDVLKALNDQD